MSLFHQRNEFRVTVRGLVTLAVSKDEDTPSTYFTRHACMSRVIIMKKTYSIFSVFFEILCHSIHELF